MHLLRAFPKLLTMSLTVLLGCQSEEAPAENAPDAGGYPKGGATSVSVCTPGCENICQPQSGCECVCPSGSGGWRG